MSNLFLTLKLPDMEIKEIKALLSRVSCEALGMEFDILVERDKEYGHRIYLQIGYVAPCSKTSVYGVWRGRKWYLSKYMTKDEIIKTAYAAFEAAVKHEVMEGFKVDGKILFNPHVDFEALLKVSDQEVKRQDPISGYGIFNPEDCDGKRQQWDPW